MRLKDVPLLQPVTFSSLDGEPQIGLHVATVELESGLAEYLVVYDPSKDKIMAFQKQHVNPDDPNEFNLIGIENPELLTQISDVCNAEGVFDHLPERIEDEQEADSS